MAQGKKTKFSFWTVDQVISRISTFYKKRGEIFYIPAFLIFGFKYYKIALYGTL
jgi:hypothetical protein